MFDYIKARLGQIIDYIKERFSERSTWIGLGAGAASALTAVGQWLDPFLTHTLAIIAALGMILVKEKPKND